MAMMAGTRHNVPRCGARRALRPCSGLRCRVRKEHTGHFGSTRVWHDGTEMDGSALPVHGRVLSPLALAPNGNREASAPIVGRPRRTRPSAASRRTATESDERAISKIRKSRRSVGGKPRTLEQRRRTPPPRASAEALGSGRAFPRLPFLALCDLLLEVVDRVLEPHPCGLAQREDPLRRGDHEVSREKK